MKLRYSCCYDMISLNLSKILYLSSHVWLRVTVKWRLFRYLETQPTVLIHIDLSHECLELAFGGLSLQLFFYHCRELFIIKSLEWRSAVKVGIVWFVTYDWWSSCVKLTDLIQQCRFQSESRYQHINMLWCMKNVCECSMLTAWNDNRGRRTPFLFASNSLKSEV